MDAEFCQERIAATKAQIVAYEDAVLALADTSIQSYTLDTGQSRQVVTRYDIASMQKTIDSLYNRLVTLQARCNGGGSVIAQPTDRFCGGRSRGCC